MSVTIELATHLDAAPDTVWRWLRRSALLRHVAAPLIRFEPHGGSFPEEWEPGEYRAQMYLFGAVPLGWQAIRISLPEPLGDVRFVRDDGYSPLIRRWDHWIAIGPDTGPGEGGTRYSDQVTIDAGILTPMVAAFARTFYAHRQRRWRTLARTGFVGLDA
jgi:hypothetical protein